MQTVPFAMNFVRRKDGAANTAPLKGAIALKSTSLKQTDLGPFPDRSGMRCDQAVTACVASLRASPSPVQQGTCNIRLLPDK